MRLGYVRMHVHVHTQTNLHTRTHTHTNECACTHTHTLSLILSLSASPVLKSSILQGIFWQSSGQDPGILQAKPCGPKKYIYIQYSIYTFVHLHFFHLSNIYPEDLFMVIYRFHILLFSAMEYSYRGDAVSSTSPIFVDIFSLLLFINTASINIHLSVFWEQNPRSGVARLKDECTYNFARYFTIYFFNVYF